MDADPPRRWPASRNVLLLIALGVLTVAMFLTYASLHLLGEWIHVAAVWIERIWL